MVRIFKEEAVIFDLDDLLYKEFDFVRSGFWAIAKLVTKDQPKKLFRLMMAQYFLGNEVLNWLINDYLEGESEFTLNSLLAFYRNHRPDITLGANVQEILSRLKENGNPMGVITDGRSVTQRNKIEALNLKTWMDVFSISEELGYEKPSKEPYLFFMEKFDVSNFVYIADNYNKDFIAPNQLGWRTIALVDNGLNIHTMKENLENVNLPSEVITSLSELIITRSPLVI